MRRIAFCVTIFLASIDSMSAACLLERYMEDSGEGSVLAEASEYPVPAGLDNFDYNTVRLHIKKLYGDKSRS